MSKMSLPEALEGELKKRLGPVYFSDLRAHLERDGVFIVRADLDLVACGVAVAMDDVDQVASWIKDEKLRKPSLAERETWPKEAGRRWMAIVVQPFVLVQDAPDDPQGQPAEA